MTYCLAISVNDGLVFCSDSRTNAGPDVLSTYSKMHIFNPAPDRLITILSAGNLATTQAIVARIEADLESGVTNLMSCTRMIEVARYVAQASREEQSVAMNSVTAQGVDTSATLIVGGQLMGGPPSIFMIYSAGNFIADCDETPFLQIGESKYGKPILDRIITRNTSLEDAARCALVSMDSTLKSNATVGPPIELLMYRRDSFFGQTSLRLGEDNEYLRQLRASWNEALQVAFTSLPTFDWEHHVEESVSGESPNNVIPMTNGAPL